MGYDSFENPEPMCEEIAQMITDTELLKRERKAYRLIAEASVSSKGIHDLCKMIITGLVKIFEFDLGIIQLKSSKDDLFRVMASAGIYGGLKKKLQPASPGDSESISMLSVTTGKPIFAPDIDTHEISQTHAARVAAFGGKAFISWPLHDSSKKVIGVATLVAYSPKKIFDKDKTFSTTIADMLTLVIEHKIANENIKRSLKEIEIGLYKHKIERKLKKSKEWLTTVLKSIGDAVITTNNNGHVTFMNPVAENLTGWNQEDASGKNLTEIFNIRPRISNIKFVTIIV